MDSVDRIVKKFSIPLRNASVDTDLIVPEFSSLMQYAVHFISLSTLDYRAVWWRIFHAPNASEWFNALALARLLFSLPTSNAKLERAFSQMNLIKNNKRTLMANDTLKDLLALGIDPVPLNDFNPDAAVDLWWRNKSRRPNQKPRKSYKACAGSTSSEPCSSTSAEAQGNSEEVSSDSDWLQDWDRWMCDSDSD